MAAKTYDRQIAHQFKIWKTIKLGTGLKTVGDFHRALRDGGFHLGEGGNDIIHKPAFTRSPEEVEIELVRVTVAELGFKYGTTRKDIYERAIQLGLELCPAEVGPQLRLQYKDQPRGEWLFIGMEPIANSDGELVVFQVGRFSLSLDLGHRGLWLMDSMDLSPDKCDKRSGNELWVFASSTCPLISSGQS